MLGFEQVTGERGVIAWHLGPQVEAAVRTLNVQYRGEDRQYCIELFAVQVAVGQHVFFIVPGGNARQLGLYRHGAAVVGAVEQERLDDLGVAGHEA
ncbi:hypothetical protein D3C80_1865220 [compost metagenome]